MITANKSTHVVRASAVLTGTYVAGTVFSTDEHNAIGILVNYTKGDETTLELKIESSIDGGTTYAQQTVESATGGVITATAAERQFTGTGKYWVLVHPFKADTVKISVKATGGTPTGPCAVSALACNI
jgi:hypothetical protein